MRAYPWLSATTCALLVNLYAPRAGADVYRCVGDDETVSYQQIPCELHSKPMRLDTRPSGWSALRPGERRLLNQYHRQAASRRHRRPDGAPETAARTDATARACWKKRRQLAAVRAHLQRGYKLAEADALHRERDDYADYLREFCQ